MKNFLTMTLKHYSLILTTLQERRQQFPTAVQLQKHVSMPLKRKVPRTFDNLQGDHNFHRYKKRLFPLQRHWFQIPTLQSSAIICAQRQHERQRALKSRMAHQRCWRVAKTPWLNGPLHLNHFRIHRELNHATFSWRKNSLNTDLATTLNN